VHGPLRLLCVVLSSLLVLMLTSLRAASWGSFITMVAQFVGVTRIKFTIALWRLSFMKIQVKDVGVFFSNFIGNFVGHIERSEENILG